MFEGLVQGGGATERPEDLIELVHGIGFLVAGCDTLVSHKKKYTPLFTKIDLRAACDTTVLR